MTQKRRYQERTQFCTLEQCKQYRKCSSVYTSEKGLSLAHQITRLVGSNSAATHKSDRANLSSGMRHTEIKGKAHQQFI